MRRPAALLFGLGLAAALAGCGGAGGAGTRADEAARSAAAGDSMAVRARAHAIRALITFDDQTSVFQFELRLLDALADETLPTEERATFDAVAEILRTTRRNDRSPPP